MPRLFVGLELPDEQLDHLLNIKGGVQGARWQEREQLHLTLRFIGDVDGRSAHDVVAALSELKFTPFQAQLSGVGNFGKNGFMRALWAGAQPVERFENLHKKIDRKLTKIGLEAERRRYRPHVTLARFSKAPKRGEIEDFMHRNALFQSSAFEVSCICLFLSELGHMGAHYTVIERFEAVP